MKRLVLALFMLAPFAHSLGPLSGFCEAGGIKPVTQGLASVTNVQGSYPKCLVTVYVHGTVTTASLSSDSSGTPLANPFTANSNGYWQFYSTTGRYDIVNAAGVNSMPTFTRFDQQIVDSSLSVCNFSQGSTPNAMIMAAVAALPSSGGLLDMSCLSGTQTLASGVVFTKSNLYLIFNPGSTWISPSGIAWDVQANNVQFDLRGATLRASTGTTEIVRFNQCNSCAIRNGGIDLNNITSAKGIHNYGSWLLKAENIAGVTANTVASSTDLYIESFGDPAVPGPRSTYGGAFIGQTINFTGRRINVVGLTTQLVTTQDFISISVAEVSVVNARVLTFVKPVVQNPPSGAFFTLNNLAGGSFSGGDYEGTGTIYALSNSSRGLISMGNQVAAVTGSYKTGSCSASCFFFDDGRGDPILFATSAQTISYQNANWNVIDSFGISWQGDTIAWGVNATPISGTQADLADQSMNGWVIECNTSQQCKWDFIAAGSNPRSRTSNVLFDGSGITVNVGGTTSRLTVTGGAAVNGSGLKHRHIDSGCTTAASAGSVCTTTITWGTPFIDTGYTAICTGEVVASGVPLNGGITAKIAASITFQTVAATAAAAGYSLIDCIAVHN